jgi:vancomycin permeability regulator SanA
MRQFFRRMRTLTQRLSHLLWRRKWWVSGAMIALLLLVAIMPVYANMRAHSREFSIGSVPPHDVAIVFGAGVEPDHQPTPFLESRLLTAVQLYKTGKVKVLLVSGDNRTMHYDEPTAMHDYLIKRGVPDKAIVLDYAGRDTYDTCYRAKVIFGITSAILVTHGYHMPRALMTCNALDITSVGVAADREGFGYSKNYLAREVLSINKAAVQLVIHAKPGVLGSKENGVATALAAS